MKNAYEVLRAKEIDVSRLQMEVDALRMVAPLLAEDGESGNGDALTSTQSTPWPQPARIPKAVNSNPQPGRAPEWKEKSGGLS
jgi:hypothetical protein